ncbi:MAG: dihydropteroate synthase [Fimbriimonas sp.]
MGILNVTPDSFSDGGVHSEPAVAIAAGHQMIADGADILDVGGESTRPGSDSISVEEELRRVLPVVSALADAGYRVSIDTMKSEVARHSLQAGASIVNDVSALRDPEMASLCAEAGCTVCLMHMNGDPKTMQLNPQYDDVVAEVRQMLIERAEFAKEQGIQEVWIDPGIGFGKTTEHNLLLLNHLDQFTALGYPVLIGVSRKAFIGRILGSHEEPLPLSERLEGSLAAQLLAQVRGASIIRTHDVKEAKRTLSIAAAILSA